MLILLWRCWLLGDRPFVILNGDTWTDYPFVQLSKPLGNDLAHLVLTATPSNRTEGDFGLDGDRVTLSAEAKDGRSAGEAEGGAAD